LEPILLNHDVRVENRTPLVKIHLNTHEINLNREPQDSQKALDKDYVYTHVNIHPSDYNDI